MHAVSIFVFALAVVRSFSVAPVTANPYEPLNFDTYGLGGICEKGCDNLTDPSYSERWNMTNMTGFNDTKCNMDAAGVVFSKPYLNVFWDNSTGVHTMVLTYGDNPWAKFIGSLQAEKLPNNLYPSVKFEAVASPVPIPNSVEIPIQEHSCLFGGFMYGRVRAFKHQDKPMATQWEASIDLKFTPQSGISSADCFGCTNATVKIIATSGSNPGSHSVTNSPTPPTFQSSSSPTIVIPTGRPTAPTSTRSPTGSATESPTSTPPGTPTESPTSTPPVPTTQSPTQSTTRSPTRSSTRSPTRSSTQSPTQSSTDSSGMPTSDKIAIVLGSTAVIVCVAIVCWWCRRRHRGAAILLLNDYDDGNLAYRPPGFVPNY